MAIKQTKRKTRNNIKRRPLLVVGLILLMAVIALIVAKLLASNAGEPNSDITDEQATQVEPQAATESETLEPEEGKNLNQYEGSNPNDAEELTGIINYSGVNGDQLMIRINIDQFVSGTCNLTLTSGSKTVTRSTSIINNPSSSTCDGFDIPVSELGSGTWQIKVNLSSSNKTGIINGEVTL